MGQKTATVIEFNTSSIVRAITRPADTTPYTAGDVVSGDPDLHFTFPKAARIGGGRLTGVISGARITSSANVATKADLELWLFRADVAARADNLAIAFTDAEMLTRIGIIQFPTANWFVGLATAGAGGNAGCESMGLGIPYQLAAPAANDTPSMYGQLVVRNAYEPVSAEIFTVELLLTLD